MKPLKLGQPVTSKDIAMLYIQQRMLKACKLAGTGYDILVKAIEERFNVVPTNNHWAIYDVIHQNAKQLISDDFLVASRLATIPTIITPSLRSTDAWRMYQIPLDSMMADNKYTWGRAIMVIIYTQILAQSCLELGYMSRIAELIEFCARYVSKCGMDRWIDANGGWEYLLTNGRLGECSRQRDLPIQVLGTEPNMALASSGSMLKVMANRIHCLDLDRSE